MPPPSVPISVVVPAYNAERFLRMTLRSITAQTMPLLEVIVVDDGSTDGTADLVREHSKQDERIRLLQLARNTGLPGARNAGIEAATSTWVALCDADDLWAPEKLERQLLFLRSWDGPEPIVALGTWGYRINAQGEIIDRALPADNDTAEQVIARRQRCEPIVTGASSVLLDRTAWAAAGGFRDEFVQAEDIDMWTRLVEHGLVMNLPEYLSSYRIHGGSMTDDGFITQRINIDRIACNARRRRSGQPELDYGEFIELQRRDDPRGFDRKLSQMRAQALFRAIGVAAANGRSGEAARLTGRLAVRSPRILARGVLNHLRQRR